ncbi:hypothetical protein AX14_006439 [Amanita brunnescens Koide BX004]|nr:hypothetical protein AX14_006439 [Amanita brunnescens Koide BX004]
MTSQLRLCQGFAPACSHPVFGKSFLRELPTLQSNMSLLANILGFSAFGLAVRMGQLGIQRRNLLDNPGAHLISMGVFGFAGYWAYKWELHSTELIAERRAAIADQRRQRMANAAALADA